MLEEVALASNFYSPDSFEALQQAGLSYMSQTPDSINHSSLAQMMVKLANSGHITPEGAIQFLSNAPKDQSPGSIAKYVQQAIENVRQQVQQVAQSGVNAPQLGGVPLTRGPAPQASTTEQQTVQNTTSALHATPQRNWWQAQMMQQMPVSILQKTPQSE